MTGKVDLKTACRFGDSWRVIVFPHSKDPLPASPAQPEGIPHPEHAGGPHDKIHYYLPDGE